MTTLTGKIENATGATLHATLDFVSRSTPLLAAAGVVTVNTDARIKSNPGDGAFFITLAAGNYQVTITAQGQSTAFNIAVPPGDGTAQIETLITTPLPYTSPLPLMPWTGQIAGNLTFAPVRPPPKPGVSQVPYPGGNINADGFEHYAYWVSYVTQYGETTCSPIVPLELMAATPDRANRISLVPNVALVTHVHIWRSTLNNGHNYDPGAFPLAVCLLATVNPQAGYYDDWESPAQFAARVDASIIAPIINTTAGQLLSSNGTPCFFITDRGLFFPGTNCRIVPGVGLQIYNGDTQLWHTLLNTGTPPAMALDAGNPS